MRTETKLPQDVAKFATPFAESKINADVYMQYERPVAIVLWRGNEPAPYLALKDSDDGRLQRFALTANDDVPKHQRRDAHLNVTVETFKQLDTLRAITLRAAGASEPFLTVVGSNSEMRTYPFNDRSYGIFADHFRDRDGLPVGDTTGYTLRATLHGRSGRDWGVERTAALVAEYSSRQIQQIAETVAVKSRDPEWQVKHQNNGIAGTDELAAMLARRWSDVYQSGNDKAKPLPDVEVVIEENTFSFYVKAEGNDKKVVRVHQFTDFRSSILEDDFPFGSSNEWKTVVPSSFTGMEAINTVGATLLKDWGTLPKTYPAQDAPPYDRNDMDQAVEYSKHTRDLFAKGDFDASYAHYMRDPNGGAHFKSTTKEEYIAGMYSGRDVHGKPVYPQPEGYEYAGFTVGHEAHLRDDNSWAKVSHIFEFEKGKPYVMLDFERPISTFTDDKGRLKVIHGVTNEHAFPAHRDTTLLVAADQVDGVRPLAALPTPQANHEFSLQAIRAAIKNTFDFLDDRLIDQHTDSERIALLANHAAVWALGARQNESVAKVMPVLEQAHDLVNMRWANPNSITGRQAVGVVNNLRTAMTYAEHGLEAIGGKLPERVPAKYEMRLLADDRLDSVYHTSAHAKGALDELDSSKPLTYYVVHAEKLEPRLSANAEFVLAKQGRTAAEYFEARDNAAPAMTDAQRDAVTAFRDANGRNWKDKLGDLWASGGYARKGIDTYQAALLQQVRNQLGPEWLAGVKRADLDKAVEVTHSDSDLSM